MIPFNTRDLASLDNRDFRSRQILGINQKYLSFRLERSGMPESH